MGWLYYRLGGAILFSCQIVMDLFMVHGRVDSLLKNHVSQRAAPITKKL